MYEYLCELAYIFRGHPVGSSSNMWGGGGALGGGVRWCGEGGMYCGGGELIMFW